MNNLEKQFDRWISIIRAKANEYEHKRGEERKPVSQPSLDCIYNEMEAFKNGFIAKEEEK